MARLNNCRFNPTAGGTTDWTYSSIVAGYNDPVTAGAATATSYEYFAISADQAQFEGGKGNCTITGGVPTFARTTVLFNSSGTTSKINFTLAPSVAIVIFKDDLISVDEANSFTATQRAQARTNINAVLKGHLFGLTLSTAGASATFGVAAGEAADSTGVDLLALASAYTKTTAAWAVGTGNGSFDGTGLAPTATAGWYHVHLIKRLDTGVVDLLTSNSATAPTLPTNYTLFRRIGSMKTNGSFQWISFLQTGDNFTWVVGVFDANVTNPGTAAVLRTLSVPLGLKVEAIFTASMNNASGVANGATFFSDPDVADYAPVGGDGEGIPNLNTTNVIERFIGPWTNASSQIRTRAIASSAGTGLVIFTRGWNDPRGRLT